MSLPDPATFIAQGASAEIFRLDGGRVLKLFHVGVNETVVARELEAATLLRALDLPVAIPLEQRAQAGRLGIVYTEIVGPNLLQYLTRRPDRLPWALDAMAKLQVRIHGQRLPDFHKRRDILADDIFFAPMNDRLRMAALERLEQLRDDDRLCHGDFHPANIIVTQDGGPNGGALAVIDWSKAATGEPASDVVRSEMLMRFGPGEREAAWRGAARDLIAWWYVRRYRAAARLAPDSLDAWRGLVALAWVRQRQASREDAFQAYLARALERAGLPAYTAG